MLKQSPSRNSRSKGFKVKHVIQICILLAICIWFLYQAKRSHDKRNHDEGSEKILEKLQNEQELLSIGRKGLHPKIEETVSEIGKGEEDVRDEETKSEENEDEGRVEEDETGEDLIDENDEKDKEEDAEVEQEIEEKENFTEDEILSDDHDLLESDSQEAREEHYKQDDASSEVVHNAEDVGLDADSTGKLTEKEQHNIINTPEETALYKESLNKGEGRTAKDGAFRSMLVKSKLGDDCTTDVIDAHLNTSLSSMTKPYKNTMAQTQTNASLMRKINFPEPAKRKTNMVSKMQESASSITNEKDAGTRTGKSNLREGNQDPMAANKIVDEVQTEPFGTAAS